MLSYVSWTARKSNRSIPKEINPEYLLEGLRLKLKLQYFGHLMQRTHSLEIRPWCWKRLRVEGEGGNRGWDGWKASLTQWTRVWVNSGRWCKKGKPSVLQSMGSKTVGLAWATEQQQMQPIISRQPVCSLWWAQCSDLWHLQKEYVNNDQRNSLSRKWPMHQPPAMCDKVPAHPQLGTLPRQEVGLSLPGGCPSSLTLEET